MRYLYIIMSVCVLAFACKTSAKTELVDSPSEGHIRISVEESFKPFIEQELKVFALSYPNANIEVAYKSEIECFKDLASDSTRMIIVTRGLDKKEQANYKYQLNFAPTFGILAYNAIAVVVNKKTKDSVFSMADLSASLSGKNNKQVVMDGGHLTGVVRFLKDSLLHETAFGKNVVAANGSEEVISYIKEYPNAIGFVGMNWVG
ncbi:MAG: PstS family phosphate ABC transporter substrate-binding protein, partial [Burkholderiaceae bacterium]